MLIPRREYRPVRNRILGGLSSADFEYLRPLLQPYVLRDRQVLQELYQPVEFVNFVEAGAVSLITMATGSTLETAMIGRWGATPASVILGVKTCGHRCVVQFPGTALRLRTEDLERSMNDRPQIRDHLLRYVQSVMVHASQNVLCGVRHRLEQRLACWLCLACDALDSNILAVTQDQLSTVLGFRRAGVSQALALFESQGLIKRIRLGILQVRDRDLLESRACSCYGVITDAYGGMKKDDAGEVHLIQNS